LSDPSRRVELSEAFEKLGVRIGLNFGSVQRMKRVTRESRGGVMVFDERDLPIPLHGALNVAITKNTNDTVNNGVVEDVSLESPRETEGNVTAHLAERRPLGTMEGRQEGVSFTKGSRGDWTPIELFLSACNEMSAAHDVSCT